MGQRWTVQQEYGGEVTGALVPTTGPALVRGDVAMAVVPGAGRGPPELDVHCLSCCQHLRGDCSH